MKVLIDEGPGYREFEPGTDDVTQVILGVSWTTVYLKDGRREAYPNSRVAKVFYGAQENRPDPEGA